MVLGACVRSLDGADAAVENAEPKRVTVAVAPESVEAITAAMDTGDILFSLYNQLDVVFQPQWENPQTAPYRTAAYRTWTSTSDAGALAISRAWASGR